MAGPRHESVFGGPNRFPCKQLRTARGWSQHELYDRLCRLAAVDGERLPEWPTFKRNLSRWENDTIGVSPFYRRLLDRLFDLNPVDAMAVAA